MTTLTVFFDEAGNTGAALADPEQPIFVLASTDIPDEEASAILAQLRNQQTREIKFTSIRKSDAGRRRLLDLIESGQIDPKRVKTMVTHKRFMIVTKFVDIIEESLAHAAGIDLYERGANLALSNLHYYVSPVFCGESRFNEFLASFVEMIRRKSNDSKSRFFRAARDMYEGCYHEEHKKSFVPYIYAENFIDDILDNVTYLSLDPAIPSFFLHCVEWGQLIPGQFDVIHDASKPMAAEKETLEALMDQSIQQATIGYDRRKFQFPLKATGISFADSLQHPSLQLADIIAGATNYWASALALGKHDEFAIALETAGIKSFAFNAIWPSQDVTPQALGTEEIGGINAVEHITNVLASK